MNSDGRPAPRHGAKARAIAAEGLLPGWTCPALCVAVTTDTGYAYFPVQPSAPDAASVQGVPEVLGLWARAVGDPCRITCRVEDRSGEVFQARAAELTRDGEWTWIRLSLFADGAHWWGGDQNGRPDPPLKWQAMFLLDRPHDRPCAVVVELARPALHGG